MQGPHYLEINTLLFLVKKIYLRGVGGNVNKSLRAVNSLFRFKSASRVVGKDNFFYNDEVWTFSGEEMQSQRFK